MQTKPLLYGLIGFFAGGLLVSIAATTFEKQHTQVDGNHTTTSAMKMSTDNLKEKTGEDFDKAFIAEMIEHHEGAVEMSKLSATNAGRDEIKKLSNTIITSQESEITQMKRWQSEWGYANTNNHGRSH